MSFPFSYTCTFAAMGQCWSTAARPFFTIFTLLDADDAAEAEEGLGVGTEEEAEELSLSAFRFFESCDDYCYCFFGLVKETGNHTSSMRKSSFGSNFLACRDVICEGGGGQNDQRARKSNLHRINNPLFRHEGNFVLLAQCREVGFVLFCGDYRGHLVE